MVLQSYKAVYIISVKIYAAIMVKAPWSNDLVVKVLDSQFRGPCSKPLGGYMSLTKKLVRFYQELAVS